MNGKKINRWIVLFICSVLVILVLDCATYVPLNSPGGADFNTGNNGIWLRYLWYFGKKTEQDKEGLIKRLANNQIKYAFFHVRGTDAHGNMLFKREDEGRDLVEFMHARLPDVKVVAWLYVPSSCGRNGVDLSDDSSRKNLVESSKWLVERCGFDGVQLDYEFFPNDEKNFPRVLDDTRKAIGKDKFLGVATPMWYPATLWGWSSDHFTTIAEHCDQIAVMGYDSWLYHPRAFVWIVEQQAIEVTRAVSKARNPGQCKVMIGVPVYDTDKGTPAHLTFAENLMTALKGVRQGLNSPQAVPSVFEGVAPFAEYTMDDEEWNQYRKYWLGLDN
jgi:hypothetical protein